MYRLTLFTVSLIAAMYATSATARNFQDMQAQQELSASEKNTYEAPAKQGGVAPCRDEVASGYPSSVGSGSQSHRAINQSKNGCEPGSEKKDEKTDEAATEEGADKSKIDVKVGLSKDGDPEQRRNDMDHGSRGGPSGIKE